MFEGLLRESASIWVAGGWAMYALAANALFLFAIGTNVWIAFSRRGAPKVKEKVWRRWLNHPEERKGRLGELIGFVAGADDLHDMSSRFAEIHGAMIVPYGRDLKFMRRAVSVSPLLGLLGTVTGMLSTFAALATGSGGEKTMNLVASGISEALITTETGLVIAIPGLFLQYHLSRERDRYESFLAHVETVCAQRYIKAMKKAKKRLRKAVKQQEKRDDEQV